LVIEEGHIKSGKNLYNILTSTSSSIGFKHSDGRPEHSSGRDSTKAKLSQVTKGEKNPFFGREA